MGVQKKEDGIILDIDEGRLIMKFTWVDAFETCLNWGYKRLWSGIVMSLIAEIKQITHEVGVSLNR